MLRALPSSRPVMHQDGSDDYDDNFDSEDEAILSQLADQSSVASGTTLDHDAVPKIHHNGRRHDASCHVVAVVGLPRSESMQQFIQDSAPEPVLPLLPEPAVVYPDLTHIRLFEPPPKLLKIEEESGSASLKASDQLTSNYKSQTPLKRFRTFPRKPFSVSDLTRAAYCELQNEYTLTLLPGGRPTRTPAMKEGSKVHHSLEEEVHTIVRVEISSKEDTFGLKIWNIIQGLRTLRERGLTRELEVWGMVDGQIVNGIIDQLSFGHPTGSKRMQAASDFEAEEESLITNYFIRNDPPKVARQAFLTDVKTRQRPSVPSGFALRPVQYQLLMYHRFLADMIAQKLDYIRVFQRYSLDVDQSFTDGFLAQMVSMHEDIFYDETTPAQGENPTSTVLKCNTLRSLIDLLQDELRATFPDGIDSLGNVVAAEWRLQPQEAKESNTGRLLGTTMFDVDSEELDNYLRENLQWWKGERDAKGVAIEEAVKCSYCEFKDICTWRKRMDEERVQESKKR